MVSANDTTHVLVAEDDDEDYELFSMVIDELSVKIYLTRAKDGEILISLLSKNVPDILFLDLHMPCKDGRQCLREIRAKREYDSLPVVIYSSFKDIHEIEFCYREGSNFYLIKPNSMKELKEALEKIFTINWKKMLYYPPLSEFVLNFRGAYGRN